jgi:hypothetical protein
MSATRITADDDGTLSRPPHGSGHLIFGDLAVLRLIAGDELIKSPKSAVMFHFQAQRIVHPGANTLSAAGSDGGLASFHQISIYCR